MTNTPQPEPNTDAQRLQIQAELLADMAKMSADEREKLISEAEQTGLLPGARSYGIRGEQIAKLQELFPKVQEHQIPPLTLDAPSAPGFFRTEVTAQIADHLHRLDDPDSSFTTAFAYCGELGKRVLTDARKRVNTLRRQANLPLLDAALRLHRRVADANTKATPEEVDAQFVKEVNGATKRMSLNLARKANSAFDQKCMFGTLSVKEVQILRECSRYLKEQHSGIYYGDNQRFLRQLLSLFLRYRAKGYGPLYALRLPSIREHERKHPNVLYRDRANPEQMAWGGTTPPSPGTQTYYESSRNDDGTIEIVEKQVVDKWKRPQITAEDFFGEEMSDAPDETGVGDAQRIFAASISNVMGLGG
nr:hypothetical protein 9 [bacterium]